MHILLFGGGGQVGTDLRQRLAGDEVIAPTRVECPIESFEAVEEQMRAGGHDWVVHSAAFTKVDDCETEPELAFRVNAIGTRNIALACQRQGASLLYVSTDYVFDGEKGEAYLESDPPNPLSVYGVSKLAGEFFVKQLAPRWVIVRTAAVFGPYHGEVPGVNFVEAILRAADSGRPLRVVDDQTTTPTFTKDLSEKIVELMEAQASGLFHVTNQGACPFYEMACKILEMSGRSKEVTRITTQQLNRPARRPRYSVLSNSRLKDQGFALLRPWEEALSEYLDKHRDLRDG
ncbi:MAG: dTDP-4-dehydrorhamnose reductase [Armatimonadetes bacterium]|nr:dTDP-4-dehydrorhamnose reductase [Armatimonadota bacterium]